MVSVRTAAEMTRTSKTTIQRNIKAGKLSAQRNEAGEWEIDPAELARVMTIHDVNQTEPATRDDAHPTPDTTANQPEPQQTNGADQAHHETIAELLKDQIDVQQATIDDLRERLDRSESERQRTQSQLAGLLTHQSESQPEPPRSKWRLFG